MRFGSFAFVLLCSSWTPWAQAAPTAELWSFWDVSDAASSQRVDHAPWQNFLDRYLRTGADGINRVAYEKAVGDGGRERLQAYLDYVTAMDPRTLNRKEQLAYFINLYNALTVEVVFKYPRKGSILRMGKGFFVFTGPWDDKLVNIAGQDVTLNDIEHRILRPIWQDRRIHFAVNCASLGCPDLRKTAFQADNAEFLLNSGESDYINHPRGVMFDSQGRLTLSSIFDWYQVDFATTESTLLTYLAQHHAQSEVLSKYDGRISYEYDWSLNSQIER